VNLIKLISAGTKALKKGKIIANPARAKRLQITIVNFVAFGMAAREFLCAVDNQCYGVSQSLTVTVMTVAAWIAFGAYHAWSTWATSSKVGWGKAITQGLEDLQNDAAIDTTADPLPLPAHPVDRMRDHEGSSDAKQVRPDNLRNGGSADLGNQRGRQEPGSYERFMGVN
jgi:hypothetical protein